MAFVSPRDKVMLGMPGMGPWTRLQEHVLLNEKGGAVDTGPAVEHGSSFGAAAGQHWTTSPNDDSRKTSMNAATGHWRVTPSSD